VDFDDFVEAEGSGVETSQVAEWPDFSAKAFVLRPQPHRLPWGPFLQSGFPELTVGSSASVSAVLVIRVGSPAEAAAQWFAFTFGPTGRFLLRRDCFARGYGLRTALNLIYPRSSSGGPRLRAVQSKRRSEQVVRASAQSSSQADFEMFDINQLRDVLGKAVGVPEAPEWGKRISGSDSLTFDVDVSFDRLGDLCRRIDAAHAQRDYVDRFAWIDNIQTVTDPHVVDLLTANVLQDLRTRNFDRIDLAPPEIIDWDRVASFRYHFDRRRARGGAVLHPDLRIRDYVAGLARLHDMDTLDVDFLRGAYIFAVDGDERDQAKWSVWRCLVAQLEVEGRTYLLDEGEFVEVSSDYLAELNRAISAIPMPSRALPATTVGTVEDAYNRAAADGSPDLLRLDRQTVRIEGRTTPIEICDLLSRSRELIHVKRHLGSSDLSHLFAQGLVSAELLQSSVEFRRAAQQRISEAAAGRAGFDFVTEDSIVTSGFEVVYAIAARWDGRSMAEALPFFSKINLREVSGNLTARGFKVSLCRVAAT
jgi:uncharacterized protein (TIGR04141 family)